MVLRYGVVAVSRPASMRVGRFDQFVEQVFTAPIPLRFDDPLARLFEPVQASSWSRRASDGICWGILGWLACGSLSDRTLLGKRESKRDYGCN